MFQRNSILFLFVCFFIFSSRLFAHHPFFVPGHVMMGISGGGGSSNYSEMPFGGAINLNLEIIMDTWRTPLSDLSIGIMTNGSVFIGDQFLQGGHSMVPTFHVSVFDVIDWYVGIGFGIALHKNTVKYGVGLATGFNIEIREWFLVSLGFDLQGPQMFGSAGLKFRFEILS